MWINIGFYVCGIDDAAAVGSYFVITIINDAFPIWSYVDISPLGKYVMSLGSHHSQTEWDREIVCVSVIRFDTFTHSNLNGYGYRSWTETFDTHTYRMQNF